MSRNDGHMLYQVGPLQKAEKIHQIWMFSGTFSSSLGNEYFCPNLWVRFGQLKSQVQKPRVGLVGFILLRLDIARSFLHVLGQNS